MENFGFKDLYDVVLKATYPIEINGRKLETGETVMAFDRIQISNFDEIKSYSNAVGGWNNSAHVQWESTKELQVSFVQGIFSKEQLSFLINAKMCDELPNTQLINQRETLEADEQGIVTLSHPYYDNLFMYDLQNGNKITNYDVVDNQHLQITRFTTVLLDYNYLYQNKYSNLTIGSSVTSGYFSLTARTRCKDENGHTVTGILTIPKLKLMSKLSLTLGPSANPIVGRFNGVGYPVGERHQEKVMDLILLSDDIDSDF